MKYDYEMTTSQKVFSIVAAVFVTAVFLGGAILISLFTGNYFVIIGAISIVFAFFRKDNHKPTFNYSLKETSPSDGELVSYQEYPVNNNTVSNITTKSSSRSSAAMEDICFKK